MAATTIDYTHASVSGAFPTNGQGATLASPNESSQDVKCLIRTYTAAAAIALNKVIALARFDSKIKILGGTLYCDGAVATATADVGVVPVSGLDDAAIADIGADVAIATAGGYPLLNGLASSTGKPGNMGYDVSAPSYVVMKTKTAGLAQGDVVKLLLYYIDLY